MIATVLLMGVPLLAASCGRASCLSRAASVPDLMLQTLFRALMTHVLEIRECFGVGWLDSYELLLTEESISRFERLLFDESADVPRSDSEALALNAEHAPTSRVGALVTAFASALSWMKASTSPRSALIAMIVKSIEDRRYALKELLIKYSVFKMLLYGGLSQNEQRVLKTIFSIRSKGGAYLTTSGQFIDSLKQVKSHGDLFATLAAYSDINPSILNVMIALACQEPDAMAELVMAYVKNKKRRYAHIPVLLFRHLTLECRYLLATVIARLGPYYMEIDWGGFYFLSVCSDFPSEEIKARCLEMESWRLIYKEKILEIVDCPSAEVGSFSPSILPKEVWCTIWLRLDLVFQIYTVPRVCRVWKNYHYALLSVLSTVCEAFTEDARNPGKLRQILCLELRPWKYFLTSRLATLSYLLRRGRPLIPDDGAARSRIRETWKSIKCEIDQKRLSMPPKSYCDLYVSCCRIADRSLKFYKLYGMSDEDYVMLIRSLFEQHGAVPIIPTAFLRRDCGWFLQMLKDYTDPIPQLPQDNFRCYDKLVLRLLSARRRISPEIAQILGEKSTLYRLLLSRDSNVKAYLDTISQSYSEDCGKYMLAYSVINACLMLEYKGDPGIPELSRDAIDEFCRKMSRQRDTEWIGISIVRFLCKNHENYSVGELGTIERVLGQCNVWGDSSKLSIFASCVSKFLNSSQFTIELIG